MSVNKPNFRCLSSNFYAQNHSNLAHSRVWAHNSATLRQRKKKNLAKDKTLLMPQWCWVGNWTPSKLGSGKRGTFLGPQMQLSEIKYDVQCYTAAKSQPAKIDLNKKSLHKQKTIQNFTIDAQGSRKIKKWKSSHSASRSANHGQIGRHWLAGTTSISHVVGFSLGINSEVLNSLLLWKGLFI